MRNTITVKELAENYTEFHKSKTIPYGDTSMTIPLILYYAIATKTDNPNQFFKDLSVSVKNKILENDINPDELKGKLSTKVQEVAWCEIIHHARREDVDFTDFKKAIVIAYDGTTMTIPYALYKLFLKKNNNNVDFTKKFIRDFATGIRQKILKNTNLTQRELKGKVAHKIQENLWIQLMPEKVQLTEIEKIA